MDYSPPSSSAHGIFQAARQASLSITNSRSSLRLTSIESVAALLIEAIAETGEKADALIALARSKMLHQGFPGRKATAGNLAFPFSPSDFSGGEVYEFALYHLTDLPLKFTPQLMVLQ